MLNHRIRCHKSLQWDVWTLNLRKAKVFFHISLTTQISCLCLSQDKYPRQENILRTTQASNIGNQRMQHNGYKLRRMNPKLNGRQTSLDSLRKKFAGQSSGLNSSERNYYYSSLRMASIDEKIKTSNEILQ